MAKDPRFDPRKVQKDVANKRQKLENIERNSIDTDHVLNNSITSEKLANGAVTPDKISTDWPVFAGTFASYTTNKTNYSPALVPTFNIGFSVDASASTITIQQAGYYYVYAHQLVNTTGGVYLHIRKDTNTIVHAYSDNDHTYDLVVSALIQCSVGTIINFYYTGTTTYSWGGAHSSVSCHFVRP